MSKVTIFLICVFWLTVGIFYLLGHWIVGIIAGLAALVWAMLGIEIADARIDRLVQARFKERFERILKPFEK